MAPPSQHGSREMPVSQRIVKFDSPRLDSLVRWSRHLRQKSTAAGRTAFANGQRGLFPRSSKSASDPLATCLETLSYDAPHGRLQHFRLRRAVVGHVVRSQEVGSVEASKTAVAFRMGGWMPRLHLCSDGGFVLSCVSCWTIYFCVR